MEENSQPKTEDRVILDGKEVTRDQLKEAQDNKATRIAEKEDKSFVTLKKLHG
jgi:hypothetical protein